VTAFIPERFVDGGRVFREFFTGTHPGMVDEDDVSVLYKREAQTAKRFENHRQLRRIERELNRQARRSSAVARLRTVHGVEDAHPNPSID
jgi:hypothetical protein